MLYNVMYYIKSILHGTVRQGLMRKIFLKTVHCKSLRSTVSPSSMVLHGIFCLKVICSLESFHSVINHYGPKMFHFQYRAMYGRWEINYLGYTTTHCQNLLCWQIRMMLTNVICKHVIILFSGLKLAAIHFNQNSSTTKSDQRSAVIYPKAKKGEATVRNIYTEKLNWGLFFW